MYELSTFWWQSPGVRIPAGIARPLARAYPGDMLEHETAKIPAAQITSRMPMRRI
jgi:hypothetical protein